MTMTQQVAVAKSVRTCAMSIRGAWVTSTTAVKRVNAALVELPYSSVMEPGLLMHHQVLSASLAPKDLKPSASDSELQEPLPRSPIPLELHVSESHFLMVQVKLSEADHW